MPDLTENYPGELAHLRDLLAAVNFLANRHQDDHLSDLLVDHYSDPRIVDAELAKGDQANALAALTVRLRQLHYEVDGSLTDEGSCIEDGDDWPCPTIAALNSATAKAGA